MKNILKETYILVYNLTFFTLISVPLAIMLYCTAHLFFELKRITKWIIN
jgi:hypothetical protein